MVNIIEYLFVGKTSAFQNQCNKDSQTLGMTKSPYACCCSQSPCWQRNIQGHALMIVSRFPRFKAVCFSNIRKTHVHILLDSKFYVSCMLSGILWETLPCPANISKNWKPPKPSPQVRWEFQPKHSTSIMSNAIVSMKNDMFVHCFGPFNHWVSSPLLQSAPASNRQVC